MQQVTLGYKYAITHYNSRIKHHKADNTELYKQYKLHCGCSHTHKDKEKHSFTPYSRHTHSVTSLGNTVVVAVSTCLNVTLWALWTTKSWDNLAPVQLLCLTVLRSHHDHSTPRSPKVLQLFEPLQSWRKLLNQWSLLTLTRDYIRIWSWMPSCRMQTHQELPPPLQPLMSRVSLVSSSRGLIMTFSCGFSLLCYWWNLGCGEVQCSTISKKEKLYCRLWKKKKVHSKQLRYSHAAIKEGPLAGQLFKRQPAWYWSEKSEMREIEYHRCLSAT